MKKFLSLFSIILMLVMLGASSTVVASKIYKWVDSEGKVHYGERPPAGKGQQMKVPSKSTARNAASTPSSSSDKTDATNKFLDSVEAERKEKNEAAETAAKDKEIRDKNCSMAKKHVASLKLGGRRFEVDEKGNKTYLDDAAIQKRLKEAQTMVDKWCK